MLLWLKCYHGTVCTLEKKYFFSRICVRYLQEELKINDYIIIVLSLKCHSLVDCVLYQL